MLTSIPLLTGLILSVLYPLCFWIGYDRPLKNNFHKFHLALPNCVGGVIVVVCLLMPALTFQSKILLVSWFALLMLVSAYFWKKEYPYPWAMTIPCVLGVLAFVSVQSEIIASFYSITFIGILAGAILCASLFAMNLGHWYLNVHGLSLDYLKRSVLVFWILMPIRLLWDIYYLITGRLLYSGEMIPAYKFLLTMDGFLLWVAILFGTLLPLVCLYFVYETVKVKSTQSATGILYVVLSAVLLGDLTYKFYLIKFTLPL